jgi:hypothetical protein
MRTVDQPITEAPAYACFQIAANVKRWPELLPHYPWVRPRRKEGFARRLSEIAAWGYFRTVAYPRWVTL